MFELIALCANTNHISTEINQLNDDISQLLKETNADYKHEYLFWNFIDIKNAINKKIKSKEILQLLKSTIAKIENYQNIVCNQVNL